MQPLLSLGLVPVGFFCAIFGALLGWKQIFVERHRDLHAFLIHRPIRRTQIFWAKTAAGITVYLLATGIPLLCLVVAPGWTIGAIDRTKGWIGRHGQRFAVIMLACSPCW